MSVWEEVIGVIIEQKPDVDVDSITPETLLVDELGFDSLDFAELMIGLREKCDVDIPDHVKIHTVGDVSRYIEQQIQNV